LKLEGEDLKINLDSPGVDIRYFIDGTLKELTFQRVSKWTRVTFHKPSGPRQEQVHTIARFNVAGDSLYLDGTCQSYDPEGNLISESSWVHGRLHGAQRILNRFGVILKERRYENGFPVGTWTNSSADGTISAEIHFPRAYSDWDNGDENGTLCADAAEIHRLAVPAKHLVMETWFNQAGIKQKEIEYQAYRYGDLAIIRARGVNRSYDHDGNVVRDIHISQGNGRDTRHFRTDQGDYQQSIVWVNGGLFSEQWIYHSN
jgi:hypothetical protein